MNKIILTSLFLITVGCTKSNQLAGSLGSALGSGNAGSSVPTAAPTTVPTPNPTSPPSCTPAGFVPSGSGITPTSVGQGGTFTISCNYGPNASGTGAIRTSLSPGTAAGSCTWSSWNGSAAIFTCTAGNTPGTYSLTCSLINEQPENLCVQTNSIGNLVVTAATPAPTPTPNPPPVPTPPQSGNFGTIEANLLSYFATLVNNNKMLVAQNYDQANWSSPFDEMTPLYQKTGQYPAMYGTTLQRGGVINTMNSYALAWAQPNSPLPGPSPYNIYNFPSTMGPNTISYPNSGLLIAGSWYINPWTGGNESDCGKGNMCSGSYNLANSGYNINDLLNSSTQAYKTFINELDSDAVQLQQLQNAGIVVLYRPFIEVNGNWMWWSSASPSTFIALWQQTYNYLVNTKGLKNMLWVYNINAQSNNYTTYYPGSNYADVVSLDYYASNPAADLGSTYSSLETLGKPIMIAEFGCTTYDATKIQNNTGDYNQLFTAIHQNFPKIFAAAVWSGPWGIIDQNSYSALMAEPWVVNRAALPSGL